MAGLQACKGDHVKVIYLKPYASTINLPFVSTNNSQRICRCLAIPGADHNLSFQICNQENSDLRYSPEPRPLHSKYTGASPHKGKVYFGDSVCR